MLTTHTRIHTTAITCETQQKLRRQPFFLHSILQHKFSPPTTLSQLPRQSNSAPSGQTGPNKKKGKQAWKYIHTLDKKEPNSSSFFFSGVISCNNQHNYKSLEHELP
jgi:hypothetical protein